MAYWWVSQGKTFHVEIPGGFLWAPIASDGTTFYHWKNMEGVKPGDVIDSYVGRKIIAVSVADSVAYHAPQPPELNGEWEDDGNRIDVTYSMLETPVGIGDFVSELQALLPAKYSPLDKNGDGVYGYLFGLPPAAAHLLFDKIGYQGGGDSVEAAVKKDPHLSPTEREALVKGRIGQGPFRDDLREYWNDKCCVTGLDVVELLRASHIKPWRDSNNQERLDPKNGLLLSPAYDAAFDVGLISFSSDGKILLSPMLSATQRAALGISPEAQIQSPMPGWEDYIAFHQDTYFKKDGGASS